MTQRRDDRPSLADDDYDALRQLLLEPERSRLNELHARVDHLDLTAENLQRILPDAVARPGPDSLRLTHALTPHVSDALGTAARTRPQLIVDAVSPIIMPAIRQAIAGALREMVQSMNQTIEYSLSVRSLRWRWESLRTGKPFAEIVLLHTLRYRVEQVFLIHADTGLLLTHAAGDAVAVQDHTLVSGMLSAIRSFVQDSFGATPGQDLNRLQVGELTVWIEQGPAAVLAAVIRGTPPESLRLHLQETVDRIHREQPLDLARFTGDAAAFTKTQPQLNACLQAQFDTPTRALSPLMWAVPAALLLLATWWGWTSYQEHRQWNTYVDRLAAEPGLAVTTVETDGGRYRIEGLRDPSAIDPAGLLASSGLSADRVTMHWKPFYALDPAFVLARAQAALAPPASVRLSLHDARLIADGTADLDWIARSRLTARLIPGVDAYNDQPLLHRMQEALLGELKTTAILFEQGDASPDSPEQRGQIRRATDLLHQLDALLQSAGERVDIALVGRTDGSGTAPQNQRLSELRADAVLQALRPDTFRAITFHLRGIGSAEEADGNEPAVNRRRVSFHATPHRAP